MLLPKMLRKGVLWASLPASGSFLPCGFTGTAFTWLVWLCANLPFLLGHQSFWVRAHPNDLFLLNLITYEDPISKLSHIHEYCELDVSIVAGDAVQPMGLPRWLSAEDSTCQC